MSDFERQERDIAQRGAQDAVRSLGVPAAEADFRCRLQAQFVSGEIATESGPGSGVVPPGRSRFLGGLVAFAVAAALALAVVGLNPLPGPRVMGINGSGVVEIDGQAFSTEDAGLIAAALRPGSRIATLGDASVDLIYGGTLGVRVEPHTSAVLPRAAGRWFGRDVRSQLDAGELAIRTGPAFAGGACVVRTPQGDTTITGTLVSVYTNDELTCVCLIEGNASVATGGQDLGTIPDRKRWVVFSDDREPVLLDIEAIHEAHLESFDSQLGARLSAP